MDDYFALEPLICQRLTERLGTLVDGVYTGRDVSALLEGRVDTPAVYVLYDREALSGNDNARTLTSQAVDQYWQVMLAVRRYGDPLGSARDDAGPLLAIINQALLGWQPGEQYRHLRKMPTPGATYDGSGLNLFPLTFACRMVMTGQP